MLKKLRKKLVNALPTVAPIAMFAFVIVLTLFMRSCQRNPERTTYKRDSRTGICYSYAWWTHTHVPCTNRVKALLED